MNASTCSLPECQPSLQHSQSPQAEWLDTKTGKSSGDIHVSGPGVVTLGAPAFTDDIALRILKR